MQTHSLEKLMRNLYLLFINTLNKPAGQRRTTTETYANPFRNLLQQRDLFKLKIPSSIKVLFIVASIINLSDRAGFALELSLNIFWRFAHRRLKFLSIAFGAGIQFPMMIYAARRMKLLFLMSF